MLKYVIIVRCPQGFLRHFGPFASILVCLFYTAFLLIYYALATLLMFYVCFLVFLPTLSLADFSSSCFYYLLTTSVFVAVSNLSSPNFILRLLVRCGFENRI